MGQYEPFAQSLWNAAYRAQDIIRDGLLTRDRIQPILDEFRRAHSLFQASLGTTPFPLAEPAEATPVVLMTATAPPPGAIAALPAPTEARVEDHDEGEVVGASADAEKEPSAEEVDKDADGEDEDAEGDEQGGSGAEDEEEVEEEAPARRKTRARASTTSGPASKKRKTEPSSSKGSAKDKATWSFAGAERVRPDPQFRVHLAEYMGSAQCKSCLERGEQFCVVPYTPDGRTQTCRGCSTSKHGCRYAGGRPGTIDLSVLSSAPKSSGSKPVRATPVVEVPPRPLRKVSKSSSPKKTAPAPLPHNPPRRRAQPTPTGAAARMMAPADPPQRVPSPTPPLFFPSSSPTPPPAPVARPTPPAPPAAFTEHRAPAVTPSPAFSARTLSSSSSSWAVPPASTFQDRLEVMLREARDRVAQAQFEANVARAALARAQSEVSFADTQLQHAQAHLQLVEESLERQREPSAPEPPLMGADFSLRDDVMGEPAGPEEGGSAATPRGKGKGRAK